MTSEFDYDMVTIGGGSGGVSGSRRSAALGAKVALIENDRLGGTCVIRGCVPKKLMMYSGQMANSLQDQLQPGWHIEQARFDMNAWQDAKTREIERLEGIYGRMLDNSGVEFVPGYGQIVSPHEVKVGDRILTTRRILIATGGRPSHSAFNGLDQLPTSDNILDLREVPKRLGVIGAGYIALEFACILKSLGAQVDVFYRGEKPLRGFDSDIQERLEKAMIQNGIHLHPSTEFIRATKQGNGYQLVTGKQTHEFDFLLNATGREPNTRDLGLENIGLKTDAKGAIPVDEFSQTAVPGVFAIGDVTNQVNLTPVAIAQGRALAENEFNSGSVKVDLSKVPTAVFTNPNIGIVGLTEEQAAQRGPTVVFETEFRPMRISFSGGEQRMYMKLLVDKATDEVLGAHVLGEDAAEMIQILGVTLTAGVTKKQFDQTISVHPTSAEEWVLLRESSREVGL
ncbi:MAG: glutathione-disulfide reductase [Limnobacter sp.]|nr:glutathione-disulfide reductase [Limnobacter sp.]